MSSPARKQAENEFDDLLGHLVDELAMTPPSQSAVSLIPDPPQARVDSTNEMAAEAAAAAGATAAPAPQTSSNTVKIVGIIVGSLSAVAVAALLVFGGGLGEQESSQPIAVADDGADEQLAAAEAAGVAAEQALRDAVSANQAEAEAAAQAEAAALEKAKAEAEAAAEEAASKKKKRRRWRRKSSNKTSNKSSNSSSHGDDFDML